MRPFSYIARWIRPPQPRKDAGPIYCGIGAKNARRVFEERGFRIVRHSSEAELLWLRSSGHGFFDDLAPYQMVNHVPGEDWFSDKGNLAEVLYERERARAGTGRLRLHEFYQETYRLYEEEDLAAFLDLLPAEDDPENLWILKPSAMAKGLGVKVTWRLNGMRKRLEHPDPETRQLRYIAQRYIKNPLLLGGRKSEIRVYFMIASLDPLLVLMFDEGTTRLNTLAFQLKDYDNPLIHLTNVYQQKLHEDYDPDAVLKWTFDELDNHVAVTYGREPGAFLNELFPRLRSIIEFAVRAVRDKLALGFDGHYFGLYGVDLILDDTLRPWLTEIQEGPGLSIDDPVKARVVLPLLEEAVTIASEVRRRKVSKAPLDELAARRRFQWVVHET